MRDFLESALRMFERAYGLEHPHVATMLADLGVAYGCLGDAFKEHDYLERALQTFDRLGQLPLAQKQVQGALRIFEASSLGAGHPGALAVKRLLAKIERKMHPQEMLGDARRRERS
eukprot:1398693-Amphidinium_carterae.1